MRFFLKSGVLLGLSATCLAADLAVLRNGFTIRHELREQVGSTTRLYVTEDKASYVDVPTADIEHFEKDFSLPPVSTPKPQNNQSVSEVISSASGRYQLDPDFVSSVISAESAFNTRAVSPKGAQGLMQLMPDTAKELGVSDPFDPATNVEGGTRYLRELLERYNYDVPKALAAYNAGYKRVEQYRGVPPYRETRLYVNRIIRDYNRKKSVQQKTTQAAANKPRVSKTNSTHSAAAKGK